MLLLQSILPIAILGFAVASEFWLLLLVGLVLMKFGACGCGSRCHTSKYKKDTRDSTPKQTPLYDEDDIVPDGQSGF